jgi:hypothetical protein
MDGVHVKLSWWQLALWGVLLAGLIVLVFF